MRDILKYGVTLMLVAAFSAGTLAIVYNATEEKRKKVIEDERQNALLEVLPGAKVFEAMREEKTKSQGSKGKTEGGKGKVKEETDVRHPGSKSQGTESKSILYYIGYESEDKKNVVGYACIAEGKGYSSTIKTMVGITPDGEIIGLKILSQKETPGLGARIEEVASSKTLKDIFRRGAKRKKKASQEENKEGGKEKEGEDTEEKPWFQKQFVGKKPEDLYIEKMDAITGATISSKAVIDSVREKIKSVISGG